MNPGTVDLARGDNPENNCHADWLMWCLCMCLCARMHVCQAAVRTTLDELSCLRCLALPPPLKNPPGGGGVTPRGLIAAKTNARTPPTKRQSVLPRCREYPPLHQRNPPFRWSKAPPTKRQCPPPPLAGGPPLHQRNPPFAGVRHRQLNVSAPPLAGGPPLMMRRMLIMMMMMMDGR